VTMSRAMIPDPLRSNGQLMEICAFRGKNG
jgi:hypothetical protein